MSIRELILFIFILPFLWVLWHFSPEEAHYNSGTFWADMKEIVQ
ncbi:MAG: hypothetical protein ACLQBD_18320 [Syntrophobacteraceae bacterium]